MAESTESPDLRRPSLSPDTLAELSTSSIAQNVAAFRSLLIAYSKELTTSDGIGRRALFIGGEILEASRIIEAQFSAEKKAGHAPSMPHTDYLDLRRLIASTQSQVVQAVGRMFPLVIGTIADNFLKEALDTPSMPYRDRYLEEAWAARAAYQALVTDPGGLDPGLQIFIARAQAATDAVAELRKAFGINGDPPEKPPVDTGSNDGGEGMQRRIEKLESVAEAMARDLGSIRESLATITEKLNHMPSTESVAKISERLEHTATKFWVASMAAIPVVAFVGWTARGSLLPLIKSMLG